MTEAEWNRSDDAGAMLDFLWQQQGVAPHWTDLRIKRTNRVPRCASQQGVAPHGTALRFGGDGSEDDVSADRAGALHQFYLACCRGIWKLLPQEESRRGVELAEQFLAGKVSGKEVSEYNWYVEGAAFCIDYNTAPADIERWVAGVRSLPAAELRSMLHPPESADEIEPRELLKRVAYFVDYAMTYPSLEPMGPPPRSYRPFLSSAVLRQYVAYPGRPSDSRPRA